MQLARSRRTRHRGLALMMVVCTVLAHQLWGEPIKYALELGSDHVPDKGDSLRVVTWNLNNFPRAKQDTQRFVEWIERIDPDLLAVQEVRDSDALAELLPGWELDLSRRGGRGGQRLGFAWRRDRLQRVGATREHAELSLGGRVRPALAGYFRAGADGPDFRVIVVHLKAKPDGIDDRREQWPMLQNLSQPTDGSDPSKRDSDLIIVGDFNVTGSANRDAAAEMGQLEAMFGEVGLRRVPTRGDCTAYWDGQHRDAWKEPSLLDLIWVRDLHEAVDSAPIARPLAHCSRHACAPFRSTAAYPERDYATVSDHCPVLIDLRSGLDDD